MKLLGICGASGAGKTTLIEALLPLLRARGLRVSVIKHAHQGFEMDRPGTDTARHSNAGAFEVLIASGERVAKLRAFDAPAKPTVHQLVGELHECDWVLVEGFKHADVPKIEVWRAALGAPAEYPEDPFYVGVATDDAAALPVPTLRPVFGLADAPALADYLMQHGERFDYHPERHA